ncbi:methylated-DNA--[protein]-cysteine S-methyltransferase [Pontiellaceae bacterium B12219]|nr:methylated-DNA--[protein]-cysteine S-methyltransferase [Pontiellaceae bacterium B12219]
MSDYDRIAKVIHYLDEHQHEQPDLRTLAGVADLSVPHFHRLFSRWAGVTPKDFLQCLTLNSAKQRLFEGNSVLDSALESGLSGPGRLHDLCVSIDAASPGEIKTGGRGWKIVAGIVDSPFGKCLIAESPRGICHLSFFQSLECSNRWKVLVDEWPHAELIRDDTRAAVLGRTIFVEGGRQGALKLFLKGTPFQIKVWRALVQIPEGQCVSYGKLAGGIGNTGASRAVGSAVGKNSIAFLIPCHRVIRETGIIGGYRWGTVRKRAMLAWEASGRKY